MGLDRLGSAGQSPKRYREARTAVALAVAKEKTVGGVGGVRGGYGEELSVGLKEVVANCMTTEEWKTRLGLGCVQSGRRTAKSDLHVLGGGRRV